MSEQRLTPEREKEIRKHIRWCTIDNVMIKECLAEIEVLRRDFNTVNEVLACSMSAREEKLAKDNKSLRATYREWTSLAKQIREESEGRMTLRVDALTFSILKHAKHEETTK